MKIRVLDLFSGIGGFSLGLESTGLFETVAFCEKEEFPRKVLRKHWPHLPIHGDVHHVSGYAYRGIDLIAGGFPCQPVSVAGVRKGKEDERWLWPQFHRVIEEARPRWCLIENVPGLRTRHADNVLGDLEESGYTCWPLVVGAGAAGAPHQRKRVWVVAHANGNRRTEPGLPVQSRRQKQAGVDTAGGGWCRHIPAEWSGDRAPEPVLRGVDDGLPCGMNRRERLKVLGNAVVPQVVAALGQAIWWMDVTQ